MRALVVVLGLLVLIASSETAAPALAPSAPIMKRTGPKASIEHALAVELRAAGDDVASVAFAVGPNGRRASAVVAARRIEARAARLALSTTPQTREAAELLRALASALRNYDLGRIDALSAGRSAMQAHVERGRGLSGVLRVDDNVAARPALRTP
jgi:hypothetical protein